MTLILENYTVQLKKAFRSQRIPAWENCEDLNPPVTDN